MAAANFYAPQLQHANPPPSQNLTPAQDQNRVQEQFRAETPVQRQFETQTPLQDQFRAQTTVQDLNLFPVQDQVSPSASASSSLASSPKSLPDQLMYKNRLQKYVQQSGIQLPVYQTINEAVPHQLPSFRSSVLVDGACYISPNTFPSRKAAEQDVAKLAMISITERIKELVAPPIHADILQDLVFCKAIMNEYAAKRNMEKPIYNTVQTKGLLPTFVSALVFNGVSFTGDIGKSRKEAERLAARAAIQSLLGDSESGTIMSEVIISKHKLKMKDLHHVHASPASQAVNTANAPTSAVPEASFGMLPPCHEFIKRKREEPVAQETLQFPITFVPSVSEQPLGVASTPFGVTPTSLGTTGTSLGVSPLSLGISPTSLGIGPTSVGIALTSVGITPTSVGVTPTSLGTTGTSLGVSPLSLGINTTSLGIGPTSVGIAPTSVGIAPTSVGIAPTSVGIAPTSVGIAPPSLGIPQLSLGVGSPSFGIASPFFNIAPASKKRRKNKRKANKDLHNDSQLAVATLPSNQSAPCSVTH